MKLAGLNFKFSGTNNVSVRSNSDDVEMATYKPNSQVNLEVLVWINKTKIAQVWYCETLGGMNKKIADKILPKKIANLKDEELFTKRASKYLANKVAKQLQRNFKIPVQVKTF